MNESLQIKLTEYSQFQWELPGNGESGPNCMDDYYYQHKDHYFRDVHYCGRRECPQCFEKSWSKRETSHIVDRFYSAVEFYGKLRKPIHVTISPPDMSDKVYSRHDYTSERSFVYSILSHVGVLGGALIYHHQRMPNEDHTLTNSPHWHAIVYSISRGNWGHINYDRVKEIYAYTGWVIKNIKPKQKRSVRNTVFYLLSHSSAGYTYQVDTENGLILPMRQGIVPSVTWFGLMAYSKLPNPKTTGKRVKYCPICDCDVDMSDLVRVVPIGYDPPGESGYLSEHRMQPYVAAWIEEHGY